MAPEASGGPQQRPDVLFIWANTGTVEPHEGNIEIVTPLIAMRKAEIVRLGLELDAPFDLTGSA